MSQEDTGGEKSFEPTQHKLDEARRKGDVPKSMDLSAAAGFIGLFVACTAMGSGAIEDAGQVLTGFIGNADILTGQILGPGGQSVSAGMVGGVVSALTPLFLLPIVAALVSLVAQQAFVLAPEKLAPKLNRLSIISNAGQKFGPTGLVAFLKSVIKMIAVSTALVYYLMLNQDRVLGATRASDRGLVLMIGETVTTILAISCVIFLAIGLIDIIWQKYDHARRLRMSHQEIRDEQKQVEGDPHLKSQRNRKRQDLAENKMIYDVPDADVLIVNPTHYSVALTWSREPGAAPKCVAKGVDSMALTLRRIAQENGVPIRSDPPTARALHATVEIGDEVAPEHYRAVAAAIRFAEAIREKST